MSATSKKNRKNGGKNELKRDSLYQQLQERIKKENRNKKIKFVLCILIILFIMVAIHFYLFDPGIEGIIKIILRTIEISLLIIYFLSVIVFSIIFLNFNPENEKGEENNDGK